MGTWGAGLSITMMPATGCFELQDAVDLATVRGALATVLEATDYLETTDGAVAVAAAEVIAAAGGFPAGDLPDEVGAWVREHTVSVGPSDAQLALDALDAVESERSELQSLWSEAGLNEWRRNIADLRNRLERVAQAVAHGDAHRPSGGLLERNGVAPAVAPSATPVVREGEWYAIPIEGGGFARGLVARTSSTDEFFLGYFFGPLIEDLPTLDSATGLRAQDAVLVVLVNYFGERPWQLLGQLPAWDRYQWPIPAFGRYFDFEAPKRDLRLDYVEDDLDSEPAGTWVPAEEVRQLPREGRTSTRGVETRLKRLLHPPSD